MPYRPRGRAFAPGAYTVTATPYPERALGGLRRRRTVTDARRGAGGTAGQALRVTFRVVLPTLSVA